MATAFFGSHLTGAHSASICMFGRSAADLSIEQASIIAAMLVYPRPLTPVDSWRGKVQRRAKYARALYPILKERLEKFPR
jgi:membrane peptidoglycan carboxypeptidase